MLLLVMRSMMIEHKETAAMIAAPRLAMT